MSFQHGHSTHHSFWGLPSPRIVGTNPKYIDLQVDFPRKERFAYLIYFSSELETQNKSMNFIEKSCPFMFKLHLPFSVHADSGQQIQSSTPSPSKYFFFQISLELCAFFMFLSGFSRHMYDLHQSTLFASSGSHRHTSLQNPLPEATAIIFHCIHFLSILISPSHPCHSQLPPRRIPLLRPWPSFSTASTAASAASSRWTTLSWPFCAARSSDVQPRSARRGG